jgi:glycosyltransferase involved in cell wall biosynthesis
LTGVSRLHALADADVVVYPSQHEVFGLVALEALLVGTPVIVADDSGCGDLVRSTGGGLAVAVNDVQALASALQEVLSDLTEWRRRAERAAPSIRVRFGDDVVCAALEDVYAEIVRTPPVALSA